MRYTRNLLEKPFNELTDDELQCIGRHFLKHPQKTETKGPLVRCSTCQFLDVSTWKWECRVTGKWLNPRHTAKTITTWRRCKEYKPTVI